ncbi:portal protein [Neorhizobium alkalisoli]|uniref:Uncharacterized protein n=1 Tax=Neorhizobium alkalisoli TaxID=528178 RepID=A0A561Q7F2_9HYPH|nr:hypothetical protein [Neorhizobium alkalisoli]TWF46314.1 hypothetical protein FHW37_1159 [Neorhizobium alkalisoli]
MTATAANQRTNASQLLVESISRHYAESGYKYLTKIIVSLLIEKPEEAQAFLMRLTNNAIPIDEFSPELDAATSVAFSVMSRDQSTASLTNLLAQQMQAMQAGMPFVQQQHIYETLSRLAETAGFKNTSLFFADPATLPPPPPPPPPVDPNASIVEIEKLKASLKAQSDEADRQFQMQKITAELDLKRVELQQEFDLKRIELELKYAKPIEHQAVEVVQALPIYPEGYAE